MVGKGDVLVVLTTAPALRWKVGGCLMVSPFLPCQAKPKTTDNLLTPLVPSLEGQPASWCLFSSQVRKEKTTETLHCVEPQLNFCCTIRFIQLRTINSPSSVPTPQERSEVGHADHRFPVPWLRFCIYHVHTWGENLIYSTIRYEPDFLEAFHLLLHWLIFS